MLNSFSKFFAVLAILTGSIWSASADTQAPLRVMSFNVRTSKALDGTNSWKNRQDYFFQIIDQFSPSLIGPFVFQPNRNCGRSEHGIVCKFGIAMADAVASLLK